jgi:C-terminal processing protease CtpA/Prc
MAALALWVLAFPDHALAESPQSPLGADHRVERLARLCAAWNAAEYLHPYLVYREIDWDAAFVRAAQTAWKATAAAEYRMAVKGMFAVLADPATEVVEVGGRHDAFEPGELPSLFHWPAEGILLIDVARFQRVAGSYALYPALRGLETELEKARAVIVDLRIPSTTAEDQDSLPYLDNYAGQLMPKEARGPAERWLVHWGFRPHEGTTFGGGRSGLTTSLSPVFSPADPDTPARPVIFLANERTRLPEFAFALQVSGDGKIVSEALLSEGRHVSRIAVDLGEGLKVWIRASEIFMPDGKSVAADMLVPPAKGGKDFAFDAALSLLSKPFKPGLAFKERRGLPAARWRPARSYPEMTAPDQGYRLLAGCRLWGVIHHFYPYLHLIGDWDAAFRNSLPEFAAAESEASYVRAVMRLVAHIQDGHTGVRGHTAISELRGEAMPPIMIREIEGVFAVTRIYDQAIKSLNVGDVIHAVDGVPMQERVKAMWPLVTGSRDLTRRLAAARWGLAGPEGSVTVLTVSASDGIRRDMNIRRGESQDPVPQKESEPWRLLEDTGVLRLGYVDLTRLQVPQVDPMFVALGNTDAIIFDMRGYPGGTGQRLAARINVRLARELAQFRWREVSHLFFGAAESGHYFVQSLPEPEGEPYRGRIVMLIDERAISQAEHIALVFEQAAGAVFVGTPTAGANGVVTNFFLPGGLTVTFTGHDVRHADGRQLQRVGIQPQIKVAPTLKGLRAGRDEVLERAVKYLIEKPVGS